jgi:uncharacterized RDD family membrane protein YckC
MLGLAAAPASGSAAGMPNGQVATMMGAAFAGVIGGALVICLVYTVIEAFTGWTLGKLILGIQVGNQDGTRASSGQLLTRWALKNIGFLSTLVAILTGAEIIRILGSLAAAGIVVGCFFVLATSKQGFHDMIAKTAVYPRKQLQGS